VGSWTWVGGGLVLRDNEHSVPMAGWNIVLLQLFGLIQLQDKYMCDCIFMLFICAWLIVELAMNVV